MPSMPIYFVGKGRQFGFLDHQFGGDKDEYMKAYDEVLTRIDSPLADLAEQHAEDWKGPHVAGLNSDDADHFRADWLERWWPDKNVEQVLRAGYRAAIERARDLELPIESLWVCANENEFQVYICEGPRQVTVIVFTPPPGEREGHREHTPEPLTEDEPIWVVKKKDAEDDEYTRQGGGKLQEVDATADIILRRVRFA